MSLYQIYPDSHGHARKLLCLRSLRSLRSLRFTVFPVPVAALLPCAVLALSGIVAAAPAVDNPSFETDRYHKYPGYASSNGGITGWFYNGNVGVNPFWAPGPNGKERPSAPFADNGRVPHGKQAALLQNKCTLRQHVEGFEKGKQYIVTYAENARHGSQSKAPPILTVILGGETIVSLHPITPGEASGKHTLPYDRVESAPFTAPKSGGFDLLFETTKNDGVTVLIDQIAIQEVKNEQAPPTD